MALEVIGTALVVMSLFVVYGALLRRARMAEPIDRSHRP